MKNELPRRNRLDLNTPAEAAIYNAMQEVEKAGADVKLTEAVILLQKARDLVADYVDVKLDSIKLNLKLIEPGPKLKPKRPAVIIYHRDIYSRYKKEWVDKSIESIRQQTHKDFDVF